MYSRAAGDFDEQFVDAAIVDGLGGEAEAAEGGALAGVRDDFEFAHEQSAHGIDVRNLAEVRIFAAEIFDAGRAADTPFARPLFLQNVSAGVGVATNFADDLLEDVVNGDQAGGAAEFIEDDGKTAALALERLQKLEQIHARGNEGGKLDRFGEIDVWVEKERTRVENADDGIGSFVVNRNAAVFMFARGLNHFFHAEIVRDAGHRRAGLHDVARGLAFHADDLQDDFFFGAREGALLPGDFEKVLIFLVGKNGLRLEIFWEGAQDERFQDVSETAGGFAVFSEEFDRPREANGPEFGSADAERFWEDFAHEQNKNEECDHREDDGLVTL